MQISGIFKDRKYNAERSMLTECAVEGFHIINSHLQSHGANRFTQVPFIAVPDLRFDQILNSRAISNIDVFYTYMSMESSIEARHLMAIHAGSRNSLEALVNELEPIEETLYRESQFDRDLASSMQKFSALDDVEIKAIFSEKFDVFPVDLTNLSTDDSIFFAKVNHGYWEFIRSAYTMMPNQLDQSDRFRRIDAKFRARQLRTSGVTRFWGNQIYRYFAGEPPKTEPAHVSLCVSLTAGTEPLTRTIRKDFNEVSRGAAIGLIAMFDAALPGREHLRVGDGGAPRSLIINNNLGRFFEQHVSGTEACLFVVPPHLKYINLNQYAGKVYKILMPPTRICETWKMVAATLLGYLSRLGKMHTSITVLSQGACITSLIAMLFSDIDPIPNVRVRFFDLGRVLDVAVPEFLKKQSWAQANIDEYIREGATVFYTSGDIDFTLASII